MRRVIAERLLLSKTTIPHFYLTIEVDAGPLMRLRAEANIASEAAGGPKITVNDFVLKAVIAAAVKVPAVNASFAGDAIIQYGSVNLSVAVAVEEGLVTPVIRDAQKKSLREISESVKDLATRARGKKLKPEEYAGGTITVSNLGSYGIESFSAIINPPQAIIISVGAIVKKAVVEPRRPDRRRPAHVDRPERRPPRGRWRRRRAISRRAAQAHREPDADAAVATFASRHSKAALTLCRRLGQLN